MKCISIKTAIVCIALFGSSAFAGSTVGVVGVISAQPSGGFIVQILNPSGVAQTLCTDSLVVASGRVWGDIFPGDGSTTTEGVRNWLSILTAAKLSGKQVRVVTAAPKTARDRCVVGTVDLL